MSENGTKIIHSHNVTYDSCFMRFLNLVFPRESIIDFYTKIFFDFWEKSGLLLSLSYLLHRQIFHNEIERPVNLHFFVVRFRAALFQSTIPKSQAYMFSASKNLLRCMCVCFSYLSSAVQWSTKFHCPSCSHILPSELFQP